MPPPDSTADQTATPTPNPARKPSRRGKALPLLAALPAAAWLATLATVSSCISTPPRPGSITTTERVAVFPTDNLPLRAPAEVYWSEHGIPFVMAQDDLDAPLLIGMVHGHLRLGQMELTKRAAQGRLAELGGPILLDDLDHAIRTFDLGKAVPRIVADLPPETRLWLERYVEGLNVYIARLDELPPEFSLLGIDKVEPWTVEDVVLMGRLVGVDVNLFQWISDARNRSEDAWPEYRDRLEHFASQGLPSFGPRAPTAIDLLVSMSKAGSNAFAVAGSRTETGAALLASDPHVGLGIPNLWCLVGFDSPSATNLGLTFPGIPFVLVGRNRDIAWGGTNMLAASTTFYDLTNATGIDIQERKEVIKRRLAPEKTVTITDSSLGPVITDAPFLGGLGLPPTAMRWRGHKPSDEFTTFLQVSRASTFEQFRTAFDSYAVSGQNFLYADGDGNIGQVIAMDFAPAAGRAAGRVVVDASDPQYRWQESYSPVELPHAYNPESGYLVSTNNTPVNSVPPISFARNANDRFVRISELIEQAETATPELLAEIQLDSYSRWSHEAAGRLAARLAPTTDRERELAEALADWDGFYTTDSRGAVAFQLLAHELIDRHYKPLLGERIANSIRRNPSGTTLLAEDASEIAQVTIDDSLNWAARGYARGRTWGDMHRLRRRHPLGNIPLIGRSYRFGDTAINGSSTTVHKSAHAISREPHNTTFGANSRFVANLADLDDNRFVLLGGNDGWLGSANFLDMQPTFEAGELIRVPMRPETVRAEFPHRLELTPADLAGLTPDASEGDQP